ncbi:hypothetical protein CJU94_15480 [Paraburkholderia aromaticivorans]|uniref:Uncharacterized protein n=1 Tax=Paraburkholderia aromaticivorans TaxID=2026199 RepID=A0A248VLM2_9BURK|nr:hypothetical protein CJU94_15480 [Paraburkholderia aromaticivorans]
MNARVFIGISLGFQPLPTCFRPVCTLFRCAPGAASPRRLRRLPAQSGRVAPPHVEVAHRRTDVPRAGGVAVDDAGYAIRHIQSARPC